MEKLSYGKSAVWIVVLILLVVNVIAQPGFLSIDCGADTNHTDGNKIAWVSDVSYIDVGERGYTGDTSQETDGSFMQNLRYFPMPLNKSCYQLYVTPNQPYLIRLWFAIGNYLGFDAFPINFAFSIETQGMLAFQNVSFRSANPPQSFENILVSSGRVLYICLIRTSESHDPFISAIELRTLRDGMYPQAKPGTMLSLVSRHDAGGNSSVRYPQDNFDRIWTSSVKALDSIKRRFNLTNWTSDPCYLVPWEGVGCEKITFAPRIFEINLSGKNLTGLVPGDIGQLTELVELSLDNNHLIGPLPNLSSLTRLERLHLQNNNLTGSVPDWLSQLKNLKELFIENNNFSGVIPPQLLHNLSLTLNYSGNHNLCMDNGRCIQETQTTRNNSKKDKVNVVLRDRLYGRAGISELNWKARLKIALDTAQGLEYLHVSCTPKIIHRDVMTANILLDSKVNGKLADFGLSRITDDGQATHVTTTVKGTAGYLDPDYFRTQMLTDKSDVYSFGVVLLEIICGRPPINPNLPEEELNLIQWVTPYVEMDENLDQIAKIIDKRLGLNYDMKSVTGIAKLALRCVQDKPSSRPSMSEVVAEIKTATLHENENHASLPNSEGIGIEYGNLQEGVVLSQAEPSKPKDMEWGDNSSNLPQVGR